MTSDRGLLASYRNGNYTVKLYDDGTKIKVTRDDEFRADFPDSIDLKITDFCDMNCPTCHENSSVAGRHADLSATFLETVRRGTEVAVGGGNPASHPQLESFLAKMKSRGVICNMTVNELHFARSKQSICSLLDERMVHGLGISLNGCSDEVLDFAGAHNRIVVHAICGILDGKVAEKLYGKNLKILLLGYKDFGRGKAYRNKKVDDNIAWLKANLLSFCEKFNTVSFDNLALEQLDVRNQVGKDVFDSGFMGEDGTASMYVDMVKGQFAKNSTSIKRYPLTDSLDKAFAIIKSEVSLV